MPQALLPTLLPKLPAQQPPPPPLSAAAAAAATSAAALPLLPLKYRWPLPKPECYMRMVLKPSQCPAAALAEKF